MKCLVTGAAGFIGSHLCETLLAADHSVVGLDCFVPYYPRAIKEGNLAAIRSHPRFHFQAPDLRTDSLVDVLGGVEVIFHLAAMPGLKRSWADFDLYNSCNLQATQRLVEAVCQAKVPLHRFVLGSTSSVYGRVASGDETQATLPISPYGVTKLAAEHLCRAYADAHNLPLVILRYFSVYGPRQRPDMGYYQFIRWMLRDETVVITGDGHQSRSNTYVTDIAEATAASMNAPVGEIYNLGGGEVATVWDVLRVLEGLAGHPPRIRQEPARLGDQRLTFADSSKLRADLGFQPRTPLAEGLARQWEWQKNSPQ